MKQQFLDLTGLTELVAYIKSNVTHKNRKGTKILLFEMNTMDMITFDEIQNIIHNAHVFDYMRQLISDGHKLLSIEDMKNASIGSFIKYMLEAK